MKKKKEIIYIILAIILILLIISLFLLKHYKGKVNNNDVVEDSDPIYNIWSHSSVEMYKHDKLEYDTRVASNSYMKIDEDKIEQCVDNENNEFSCNHYDYKLEGNKLIIYFSEDHFNEYTYEIVDNKELITTYVGEEYTVVNHYYVPVG